MGLRGFLVACDILFKQIDFNVPPLITQTQNLIIVPSDFRHFEEPHLFRWRLSEHGPKGIYFLKYFGINFESKAFRFAEVREDILLLPGYWYVGI